MTQFQRRVHRARRILDAVGHAYPDAWRLFDDWRRRRGEPDFVDWPDWCYMPIAGGLTCVDPEHVATPTAALRGVIVTALGAWRMTQGIYRFDPALLSALLDTPLDGAIPVEHLQRLPEWCVYVDLADSEIHPQLYGAWMHMDYDVARAGTPEFRVVFDLARDPRQPFAVDGLEPVGLPLVGSIEDSLDHLARSAREQAALHGVVLGPELGEAVRSRAELIRPMLALALYLCSDADITRRGQQARPRNPVPVRSGAGRWTLHPASGPAEWDVGTRIGAALRAAYAREQVGGEAAATGRHLRPHVRRAHWHTILSGARKRDDGTPIPSSDRRAELRWMPPIPVAVDDYSDLPAVIHPVRP